MSRKSFTVRGFTVCTIHSVHTKHISDGTDFNEDEFSGNSPPENILKRRRAENWRTFVEKYGIGDYIERLTSEINRAWEYRKCALRNQYPYASFKTLSGEVF